MFFVIISISIYNFGIYLILVLSICNAIQSADCHVRYFNKLSISISDFTFQKHITCSSHHTSANSWLYPFHYITSPWSFDTYPTTSPWFYPLHPNRNLWCCPFYTTTNPVPPANRSSCKATVT